MITKFDVKKRVYYGNTSMESEMSLLMANQTMVYLFHYSPINFIFINPHGRPLPVNSFTILLWELEAQLMWAPTSYCNLGIFNFAHKPTTHFGALMFGSDIDGRQMRGKGKWKNFIWDWNAEYPLGNTSGITRAATQYGTSSRIIDLCTFDVTRNPWRCGAIFDAIVTDPPCETVSSNN